MSRHHTFPLVILLCVALLIGVVGCEARTGSLSSAASAMADPSRQRPVSRLDPALRAALAAATAEAAGDGVVLHVNSGWRSEAHQRRLFEQAIRDYGSEVEAARWVARPGASVHESGDAVDIGASDAASWLGEHGAAHGLCRIYDNEPWHFELRPDAVDHGCPATYADPTEDPRMQ